MRFTLVIFNTYKLSIEFLALRLVSFLLDFKILFGSVLCLSLKSILINAVSFIYLPFTLYFKALFFWVVSNFCQCIKESHG
jgi:hypothetical protein